MNGHQTICPGCGLSMPASTSAVYEGYFNVSGECWSVFTEVIGQEFADAVLFGQVHQLTVDAYAVQHAGGRHPDKSVAVHLSGLHLALERGLRPPTIAPRLQRLASRVEADPRLSWPHLKPPADRGAITVFDVAMADSFDSRVTIGREWARTVWATWSDHHAAVAAFVADHIQPE